MDVFRIKGMAACQWVVSMVLALTASAAFAQKVEVNTLQPSAGKSLEQAMPIPKFVSVLGLYQGFKEEAISPWRASNDLVGKIGGWREYAKEAHSADAPATPSTPSTPSSSSNSSVPAPKAHGHHGHHGHHAHDDKGSRP